jgi:hypothetical protein
MVYEVIYTTEKFEELESYVKNVFKINLKSDCLIYFHLGSEASKFLGSDYPDYLTAYNYTKELESRFKVNINWIDISYIFKNLLLHPSEDDLKRVIFYTKAMYKNSVEDMLQSGLLH